MKRITLSLFIVMTILMALSGCSSKNTSNATNETLNSISQSMENVDTMLNGMEKGNDINQIDTTINNMQWE